MLVKFRTLSIIPMMTISCLSTIAFLGTFNLPEAIAQNSPEYNPNSEQSQLHNQRTDDEGWGNCQRHFRKGCL